MARKTFECPNCGADVPVGKKGCRECGSDASTGWMDSEEIDYQSIDIPDGYGPTDEVKQGVGRTQLVAVLLLLLIAGIVTLALLN
ncbi:MAG TPA: hypothetical protein EYP98_14310 [Planctomycetes bacterium]|nr:hypothetical protein [Planctomycetota bacterium]